MKNRIYYKHTRIFHGNGWHGDDLEWVKPGKKCMLVRRTNIMSGKEWYNICPTENGFENLNSVWLYHGDCGTAYDVARFAYGLREILAVEVLKDDIDGRVLRVTLSKDLHPEWD